MSNSSFFRPAATAVTLLAAASLALAAAPEQASAAAAAAQQQQHATSPNIVFILTDDLGYGDLGVNLQNRRAAQQLPHIQTPTLDSLADSGALLADHYCGAPVCAPSRASLYLGQHQGHANVRNNQFDKALAPHPTIASVLQEQGYTTALIGKWGLQGASPSPGDAEAHPQKRGFEYFFGLLAHLSGHFHYYANVKQLDDQKQPVAVHWGKRDVSAALKGCYSTDLFVAHAKHWLVQHHKQQPAKPFFLMMCLPAPHAQLQVASMPYPQGRGLQGGVQWLGIDDPKQPFAINTANAKPDSWMPLSIEQAVWDHDGNPQTPAQAWPQGAKRYASMVQRVDEGVADVVATLQQLGLDKNTLLVFSSDNGPTEESGAHGRFVCDPAFFQSFAGFDGIKRDTLDGGVRVPTLVWGPGLIKAQQRLSQPSQFHDWMATFCELAKVPKPAGCDGFSLLSQLQGRADEHAASRIVYGEYLGAQKTPAKADFSPANRNALRGEMQFLRKEQFKALRRGIKDAQEPFMLFDLSKDTHESRNLAAEPQYQKQLAELTRLASRLRQPDASSPRPYDRLPIQALDEQELQQQARFAPRYGWQAEQHGYTSAFEPEQWQNLPQGQLELALPKQNGSAVLQGFVYAPETASYRLQLPAGSQGVLYLQRACIINANCQATPGVTLTPRLQGECVLQQGYHPFSLYVKTTPQKALELQLQSIFCGLQVYPHK